MYFGEMEIALGSGFLFKDGNRVFLITNRHNLTGRDQNTGACLHPRLAVPDRLSVEYWRLEAKLGNDEAYAKATIQLPIDQENPSWLEHPIGKGKFDIAGILLDSIDPKSVVCANDAMLTENAALAPTMPLSVLGYPLGISSAHGLPIWVSGSMASEPHFNVEEKPAFYIDCRTNTGSSGSPVFASFYDGIVRTEDGDTRFHSNSVYGFIGIYSGRVRSDSDIGLVWRASAIYELCDPKLAKPHPFAMMNSQNFTLQNMLSVDDAKLIGARLDNTDRPHRPPAQG